MVWPRASKPLHGVCVFHYSTMQVAAVVTPYAGFFLRLVLVRPPRPQAVPHHSIDRLTAAISMWSDSCCTTGRIQRSVMTMVHPLYIRYRTARCNQSIPEAQSDGHLTTARICCSIKRSSRLQSRVTKRYVSCFWSTVQRSAAR